MIEQSCGRVRVGRQEFRAGYPDSSLSERSGLIMFSFVWHGWDLLGSWLRETQSRVKKQGSRRASTREGRPPPPQTLENRIEWERTRDSGAPLLRTDSIVMDMPAARANSRPLMWRRSGATDRRTRRLHCRMLRSARDFASAR